MSDKIDFAMCDRLHFLKSHIDNLINSSHEIDYNELRDSFTSIYGILRKLDDKKVDKIIPFEDTLVREDACNNAGVNKTISCENNSLKDTTKEIFPSLVAKVITYEKRIEEKDKEINRLRQIISNLTDTINTNLFKHDNKDYSLYEEEDNEDI